MRLTRLVVPGATALALSVPMAAQAKTDAALCEDAFARLEQAEAQGLRRFAQAEDPAAQQSTATDAPVDKAALTRELSEMLQACSFDGQAIKVTGGEPGQQPQILEAVEAIMSATGLPQNFDVIEAEVPNAAALILLDDDNIPRRVIAYNPDFMQQTASSDASKSWMATSIIAHEVGHHLSGHTLVPGGSMPPLELEADRFSGFILARLGADREAAEQAVRTLVAEAASATHPGREDRVKAIEAGWTDACAKGCEETMAHADPGVSATATEPAAETQPEQGRLAEINARLDAIRQKNSVALAGTDRLPIPDENAVPRKFTQFLYGVDSSFNPEARAKYESDARKFATDPGVEIVTIVADDLHGLTAQQYAREMLRLMRVGKLDVGNGAVMVAAPSTDAPLDDAVGVALGPGLAAAMGPDSLELLEKSLRDFVESQRRSPGVDSATRAMSLTSVADSIMREHRVANIEWFVRYPALADALKAKADYDAGNAASGATYDPQKDPIWRKITRARVTFNGPLPAASTGAAAAREQLLGPRMDITTADGSGLVLHAQPIVQDLMPVPLQPGRTYEMIIRLEGTTDGKLAGTLLSYDEIGDSY